MSSDEDKRKARVLLATPLYLTTIIVKSLIIFRFFKVLGIFALTAMLSLFGTYYLYSHEILGSQGFLSLLLMGDLPATFIVYFAPLMGQVTPFGWNFAIITLFTLIVPSPGLSYKIVTASEKGEQVLKWCYKILRAGLRMGIYIGIFLLILYQPLITKILGLILHGLGQVLGFKKG